MEAHLRTIGNAQGYSLESIQTTHALCAYVLRYKSALGNADHIKLDVNFIERVPVLSPVHHSPPDWLPVPETPVRTLALDELAGSKVATLMLRGAARDLFDVAQLAGMDLDAVLVDRVALFHGFLADIGLTTMDPTRVDHITAAQLRRHLIDLLPKRSPYASMSPDVALEELRQRARPLLTDLKESGSRHACQELLHQGTWNPTALFGSHQVDERLVRHPGMLWRLESAARGERAEDEWFA